MSVRKSKTAAGVDLKAKPMAPGDTGSASESHLHTSKDMNQRDAGGPATASHDASRGGGQKDAGMDRSQTQKAAGAPILNRVKVKQSKLIFFTTQLAVMLDSGVVLSDALDAIVEQSDPGAFRMIIKDVAEAVKSGQTFSASLTPYPKVFSSMFISMVKASEASGKMVEMLRVLSEYLNFEEDTRRRIKGALMYPMVMVIMAVVAVGVMMFFVLPKFTKIYEAKGAALPKITQMLLALSKVMMDGRKMMAVVTVLLLTSVAIHYWFGTIGGRRTIDFVKIRMPVLGTMFTDLVVARSMRIMATMVNTGVSLLDAVGVIQGSCNNYYFQQLWSATDKSIRGGYQLSDSIEMAAHGGRVALRQAQGGEQSRTGSSTRRFASQNKAVRGPSRHKPNALIGLSVIHMLRAGEKSGRLGQVSDKISVFYGKRLEASVKNVTALVEPLMIVVIGAIIGTIAIAMLLPVFRISTIIAH